MIRYWINIVDFYTDFLSTEICTAGDDMSKINGWLHHQLCMCDTASTVIGYLRNIAKESGFDVCMNDFRKLSETTEAPSAKDLNPDFFVHTTDAIARGDILNPNWAMPNPNKAKPKVFISTMHSFGYFLYRLGEEMLSLRKPSPYDTYDKFVSRTQDWTNHVMYDATSNIAKAKIGEYATNKVLKEFSKAGLLKDRPSIMMDGDEWRCVNLVVTLSKDDPQAVLHRLKAHSESATDIERNKTVDMIADRMPKLELGCNLINDHMYELISQLGPNPLKRFATMDYIETTRIKFDDEWFDLDARDPSDVKDDVSAFFVNLTRGDKDGL